MRLCGFKHLAITKKELSQNQFELRISATWREDLKNYNDIFLIGVLLCVYQSTILYLTKIYLFIPTQKANECVLSVLLFFLSNSVYAGNKN